MKLIAISMSRYNGGAAAKRKYGSSTITEFCVYRPEDKDNGDRRVFVEAGGKTPGERATAAKAKAEPLLRVLLAKEGIVV